mmetsp:Transcript_29945/g.42730  ORF Transcript_29945/g.42730 Transcript_29945/m.42730 type:complete len:83 (-) Transcript_29945:671-919(-)
MEFKTHSLVQFCPKLTSLLLTRVTSQLPEDLHVFYFKQSQIPPSQGDDLKQVGNYHHELFLQMLQQLDIEVEANKASNLMFD